MLKKRRKFFFTFQLSFSLTLLPVMFSFTYLSHFKLWVGVHWVFRSGMFMNNSDIYFVHPTPCRHATTTPNSPAHLRLALHFRRVWQLISFVMISFVLLFYFTVKKKKKKRWEVAEKQEKIQHKSTWNSEWVFLVFSIFIILPACAIVVSQNDDGSQGKWVWEEKMSSPEPLRGGKFVYTQYKM